jgi:hypothetical protein
VEPATSSSPVAVVPDACAGDISNAPPTTSHGRSGTLRAARHETPIACPGGHVMFNAANFDKQWWWQGISTFLGCPPARNPAEAERQSHHAHAVSGPARSNRFGIDPFALCRAPARSSLTSTEAPARVFSPPGRPSASAKTCPRISPGLASNDWREGPGRDLAWYGWLTGSPRRRRCRPWLHDGPPVRSCRGTAGDRRTGHGRSRLESGRTDLSRRRRLDEGRSRGAAGRRYADDIGGPTTAAIA